MCVVYEFGYVCVYMCVCVCVCDACMNVYGMCISYVETGSSFIKLAQSTCGTHHETLEHTLCLLGVQLLGEVVEMVKERKRVLGLRCMCGGYECSLTSLEPRINPFSGSERVK